MFAIQSILKAADIGLAGNKKSIKDEPNGLGPMRRHNNESYCAGSLADRTGRDICRQRQITRLPINSHQYPGWVNSLRGVADKGVVVKGQSPQTYLPNAYIRGPDRRCCHVKDTDSQSVIKYQRIGRLPPKRRRIPQSFDNDYAAVQLQLLRTAFLYSSRHMCATAVGRSRLRVFAADRAIWLHIATLANSRYERVYWTSNTCGKHQAIITWILHHAETNSEKSA